MSLNYPEVMVTLKSYDNQYDNEEIISSIDSKEVFVVTDNTKLFDYLSANKIPFAGLITEFNKDESFRKALYCIEDLEFVDFDVLCRMWQRFNNIPWKIFETNRTVVREQTIEDLNRLYEIYEDSETTRYMDSLYENPADELQYMKDYIANQYKFYEYGIWAVEDKCSGELIGRAGVSIRAGYDEPELGYVFDKSYRRQGYCTEVLEGIIDYMIENFGIPSLIAFTHEENIASIAVLNKLKFIPAEKVSLDNKEYLMYKREFDFLT